MNADSFAEQAAELACNGSDCMAGIRPVVDRFDIELRRAEAEIRKAIVDSEELQSVKAGEDCQPSTKNGDGDGDVSGTADGG